MSSTSSCIPHLARAITERRALQRCTWRTTLLLSRHGCATAITVVHRGLSTTATRNTDVSKNQRVPPSPPPPPRIPSVPRRIQPSDSTKTNPLVPPEPTQPGPSFTERARREYKRRYGDDPRISEAEQNRRARAIRIGAGVFLAAAAGYVAFVYTTYKNDLNKYEHREDKLELFQDVSDRWRNEKRNFDEEVDCSEKLMFLKAKRKRLIREAYGDVLEVSCGTGRNMELYDTRPYAPDEDSDTGRDQNRRITSLTFNDQSPRMVQLAKDKWIAYQRKKAPENRFQGPVYFLVGDAGQPNAIPRPEGGYDTVVQSMGICSMADPVGFLRQLGRLVRQPGEKIQNATSPRAQEKVDNGHGGRIFLLEHGRGSYEWLNNFLDGSAPMHADRYGCWPNKDVEQVIQDSQLVVERSRRYYFGTIWEIVLRPRPVPSTPMGARDK